MSEFLQTIFPGLRSVPFRITSPADHKYNCIAWAANDANHWWWPHGESPPVVWPPTVERELTLGAFTAAFQALGYISGADESLEPGLEKVAIFADPTGTPTHAARQLPSGQWTNKLGQAVDIEHDLRSLEGQLYGLVVLILKRRLEPVLG